MATSKSKAPTDSTDRLELKYVPLAQALRWDANPKRHDFDALIRSIETHGFGDPPKYDATLEALVYGNGRSEALERMRAAGKKPPRGIGVPIPPNPATDSARRRPAVGA